MKLLALLVLSMGITVAQAQVAQVDAPEKAHKWKGETEASSVVVSGNTSTETYGAKTANVYTLSETDLARIFGKYMRSTSGGTEQNNSWEAGLRYEKIFTKDLFSGFVQHKAEHDPYNGIFIQRDSSDVGVKYIFTKSENFDWFGELGYRYTKLYDATGESYINYARIYTQSDFKVTATTQAKLWFEYLPNLKTSNADLYNAEASISVMISEMFSLKTAYLVNYNESTLSPLKKMSSTWTTALVAKY
ncbi:DUF481 domain-containing protein [Pseudobdellovibrio exovorus]|uniref:Salt-induced outer membrane protein n=1 Tax=Pseudobdellovibrio exovorus JSS TaxID=1184267 RepID=M4V4Z6_9BACT|nr:DUF481 domain-containing protein [Pseudobdellovibrio exovorus]AGH94412.1 hypothetical protein A11Q_192 [Pseudobdellovibrio exovorus JSS]